MKISKRQLKRIIREEQQKLVYEKKCSSIREAEAEMTDKYDDDPALKGDQDELPDHLQKGIIDKSKNEGKKIKISKRQLKRIIREEKLKLIKEAESHEERMGRVRREMDADDMAMEAEGRRLYKELYDLAYLMASEMMASEHGMIETIKKAVEDSRPDWMKRS